MNMATIQPALSKSFLFHGNLRENKIYVLFALLFISGCGHKAGVHGKMPEENRFRRVVLEEHLYNPMELEIADDGNIYIIQTNGQIIKVNPATRATKLIGTIKNSDNCLLY